MSIFDNFLLAFRSLWMNVIRSMLTMLGVIIGVSAVIVIVGLGNGIETYMTQRFQSIGANMLTVDIAETDSSRYVTEDDMYAIARENAEVFEAMSPVVKVWVEMKSGNQTLNDTTLNGVGEDYLDMRSQRIKKGRHVEFVDVLKCRRICVVGTYVDVAYYGGDAIGKTLKIGGAEFEIVGVIDRVVDGRARTVDDSVYIPYSLAAKMSNMGRPHSYSFTIRNEKLTDTARAILTEKLDGVYGEERDTYVVTSMNEILSTMREMIGIVVAILAAIAAVSLVVGGIGIMNIMLVLVSERTREIGVRMALGAKSRDILTQFIVEAGVTSSVGGIVGIIGGYGLNVVAESMLLKAFACPIPVSPTANAVIMAFSISVGIGILFGYLPALKASNLAPIQALRHE